MTQTSSYVEEAPQKAARDIRPFFYSLFTAQLFPVAVLVLFSRSAISPADYFSLYLIAGLSTALALFGGSYFAARILQSLQPEKEKFEASHLAKQKEIHQLNKEIRDLRRGYEHQIDLLQSSVAKSKQEVLTLHVEMDQKLDEVRHAYLEFEDLRREYARLEEEMRLLKQEHRREIGHKESIAVDYQKTIQEQRSVLQKRQHYIGKLEAKVKELMFEIRSLLQISDKETSTLPPLDLSDQEELTAYYLGKKTVPLFDLEKQIEHLVNLAENFQGASQFAAMHGGSASFFDSEFTGFTIDLRRLFELYKEESKAIVCVCSPKEKKILYANPVVKSLLGWAPEKFASQTSSLLSAEGKELWEKVLKTTDERGGGRTAFKVGTKEGKEVALTCGVKRIEKGPFKGLAVAMLIKYNQEDAVSESH